MAVLPDIDALRLGRGVMFEKPNPDPMSRQSPHRPVRAEESGALSSSAAADQRDSRSLRRGGDALRAVEWGELTARLNAARDLRLLLRHETQASIEVVGASFGDAAASYFALLDDEQPGINSDGLGQSKAFDPKTKQSEARRPATRTEESADANRGDAREMQ